jgi:hypothetical protein
MSALTPVFFGYYENSPPVTRLERILNAVPLVGSVLSLVLCIEAVRGRTLSFDNTPSEPVRTSDRIQYGIRGAIGLIPVVGLALIPIDLVATLVDVVRRCIHNRCAYDVT